MPFLSVLFGFLKKLVLFVLIVAIAIPLWYGSTNRQYLQLRLLHSVLSLKHSLLSDAARPTLSADYRAFEDILRMKPIAERDPTADILTIIKEFRKSFIMGTLIPKPSQCQIKEEVFGYEGHTVDTYWIDNSPRKFEKNSDKLIIYLHGGGYILGDVDGELFDILRKKTNFFLYFYRL
jgi:acetyl esterase/lipase